jgi:hypothetical protein
MSTASDEDNARSVQAAISYVTRDSLINRRFVAPGAECNTGKYRSHSVQIRDARPIKDHFSLDVHGFVLAPRSSSVKDFFNKEEVDKTYLLEVEEAIKALTGATRVVSRGWMVRTSGDMSRYQRQVVGYTHQGGVQPPASEAHVDFTPGMAERMAKQVYRDAFPGGKGYTRFIATSLWRAFSEPPQDWPLALCDARSVGGDEGIPNTLHIVDRLPDEETMLRDIPDADALIAAAIFHYNPDHRWWYFSNMTRDEIVLLKFHDSDRTRAMRVPHTAFRDTSFPDAKPRSSIECRSFAFFE